MLTRVFADHAVVVANSGVGALAHLSVRSFDLILCDLALPGMSGMQIYEAIRATSLELAERVVFMTGGAYTTESHEFLSRLPNSWLEKPFDLRALKAVARARALAL
jgi:DNA-binding response OmpR family regulator